MHNHSYENEFNLHVNEISFSYERMSTKTALRKRLKVIRKWPIYAALSGKVPVPKDQVNSWGEGTGEERGLIFPNSCC